MSRASSGRTRGVGRGGLYGSSALLLAVLLPAAAAAQTAPGTQIANTARVNYDVAGAPRSATSNQVTATVAERLDVTLALTRPTTIEPGPNAVVGVTLTNAGNGTEAFTLTGTLVPGGTPVGAFAIDSDGDGRFGASDTPLANGRTPVLAPGQSLQLVLVADASASNQAITIAAASVTGSGTPGTAFAGQGDGGGDAVVGPTGARATLSVPIVGADAPAVTLEKRQAVVAPDGSANPVSGAVITYTLVARFDGAVRAAVVEDPVPAGTTAVPGSLRLDGAVLSDAADSDAGQLAAGQMRVALGDIAEAATRTISFQVTIQ